MASIVLIALGAVVVIVLVLVGLMLRRSWGGSLDNAGVQRLDLPPAAPALSAEDRAAIQALAASGNKIAAIKRVRELTGLGLKAAKEYVEAGGWNLGAAPAPMPPAAPNDALAEVYALARQGNKIAAIKRYRELTGVGLKEAKDYVDAIGP